MYKDDHFFFDDEFQRRQRDRFLPAHYLREGRYFEFLDHTIDWLGPHPPDTLWLPRSGPYKTVEEKIVRWPGYHYRSYALEEMSNVIRGFERYGWMFTSEAEKLLYAFYIAPIDRLRVHVLDLPALQRWFWQNLEAFPKTYTKHQINRSLCRVVDVAAVRNAGIEIERFLLAPAPTGAFTKVPVPR